VIERMKDFVPPAGKGDIVVNMDGKALRLRRDKEGAVEVQEVIEKPVQAATPKAAAAPKAEIPAVDGDGAEALGRHFAKGNKPVISNPFPFGDARRARFDEGWRKETGSDGMGPKDDD